MKLINFNFLGLIITLTGLIMIFLRTNGYSQHVDSQLIEDILQYNNIETVDYDAVVDKLNYYSMNPINLNTATSEQLNDLMILDNIQIKNILDYRKKYGNFVSIYELKNMNGFNNHFFQLIKPFFKVEQPEIPSKFKMKDFFNGMDELLINSQRVLEKQKGYIRPVDSVPSNNYYSGSPYKLMIRNKYSAGNKFFLGFTGEKDQGEQFFGKTQSSGFNFYSGYASVKDIGKLKSFIIGDYNVQFGQGLTLWTGFGKSKTTKTTEICKYESLFTNYVSTNENNFMRGVATSFLFGKISISAFYSSHSVDANLVQLDSSEVTSFQQTGYHRTYAEIFDKHAVQSTIYGGHIRITQHQLRIGLTAYQANYNHSLLLSPALYNQFQFQGNSNHCLGMDYLYISHKVQYFGEASMSGNKSFALLDGIVAELSSDVSFSALFRHYNKDYQNLYSKAFAENTSAMNETGLYIGLTTYPLKNWQCTGYFDAFKFPWLKYLVSAPSSGYDYFLKLIFSPESNTNYSFNIHGEVKQADNPNSETTKELISTRKLNYRFQVDYAISTSTTLSSRIELVNYKAENSAASVGYVFCQDISHKFRKIPLTIGFRYVIFDSDNFDARIYAYEKDVLYSFETPFYYDKGIRICLLTGYEIKKNMKIWLKAGQTVYQNLKTISAGSLDEINGNKKTEIKAQLIIKF